MRKAAKVEALACTETDLVLALTDLFDSMDLDGNHMLDFEELLATIVHMGMGAAHTFMVAPIKPYREDHTVMATRHHTEQILKYVPELDKVIVTESSNHMVKVYHTDTMKLKRKIKISRTGILYSEYMHSSTSGDQYDYLVTSTASFIYVWEGIQSGKLALKEEIYTSQPQTVLKWVPEHNVLYSGGADGVVHAWKIHAPDAVVDGEHIPSECVQSFEGHTDVVTGLEVISSMDLLASCSLDGTIRLWDLVHGTMKLKFEGHTAGVVGISFSPEYRFLFSASIDHEIGVWSPFADVFILKLRGHVAPLVGVHCVRGTPQVISADVDGWVKVWDARNFSCVQTFMSLEHITSLQHCGTYHKRLLIGAEKKIGVFTQEGSPYETAKDHDNTFCAAYSSAMLNFIGCGRKEVKIWNALTGEVHRVFRELCSSEITAMCMDKTHRKLIVGEHSGNIRVFNFQTGVYMKSLQSHTDEVIELKYCDVTQTVMSMGRDNVLMVHDEKPIEEKKVLAVMSCPSEDHQELTCGASSFDLSLVAAGNSHGAIYVFDVESGRQEAALHVPHLKDAITSLVFLGAYPLLAAADAQGHITFFFVRPSNTAYTVAASIVNCDVAGRPSVINSIAFEQNSKQLFTVDDDGMLKVWDITSIIHKCVADFKVDFNSAEDKVLKEMGGLRRDSQIAIFSRMNKRRPSLAMGRGKSHFVDMHPVLTVKASDQVLSSVFVMSNPPAVLTCDDSQTVRVFDLHCQLQGVLDSGGHSSTEDVPIPLKTAVADAAALRRVSRLVGGPGRISEATSENTHWKFKLDVDHLQRREDQYVVDLLNVLDHDYPIETLAKYGSIAGIDSTPIVPTNNTAAAPTHHRKMSTVLINPPGVEEEDPSEVKLAKRIRRMEEEAKKKKQMARGSNVNVQRSYALNRLASLSVSAPVIDTNKRLSRVSMRNSVMELEDAKQRFQGGETIEDALKGCHGKSKRVTKSSKRMTVVQNISIVADDDHGGGFLQQINQRKSKADFILEDLQSHLLRTDPVQYAETRNRRSSGRRGSSTYEMNRSSIVGNQLRQTSIPLDAAASQRRDSVSRRRLSFLRSGAMVSNSFLQKEHKDEQKVPAATGKSLFTLKIPTGVESENAVGARSLRFSVQNENGHEIVLPDSSAAPFYGGPPQRAVSTADSHASSSSYSRQFSSATRFSNEGNGYSEGYGYTLDEDSSTRRGLRRLSHARVRGINGSASTASITKRSQRRFRIEPSLKQRMSHNQLQAAMRLDRAIRNSGVD